MSHENVEVVRRVFEQFARGDFSEFGDLPDDFEFVTSPEVPDAGAYRGQAARRWLNAWVESFQRGRHPERFLVGRDRSGQNRDLSARNATNPR